MLVFIILSAVTLSRFYWKVELITPSKRVPVWAGWSNVDKMFILYAQPPLPVALVQPPCTG